MRVFANCPECGVEVSYIDRALLYDDPEQDRYVRCPSGHIVDDRAKTSAPVMVEGDGALWLYPASAIRIPATRLPVVTFGELSRAPASEGAGEGLRIVLFNKFTGPVEVL